MIDTKQPCPRCRRVWPAGHFASLCRDVVVEQRNEAEQALEMERAAHRATAAQRDELEAAEFVAYVDLTEQFAHVQRERDEALRDVETLRELRRMDAEVLSQRDDARRDLSLMTEQVDAARAATEQMARECDAARALADGVKKERDAAFLMMDQAPKVARLLREPAKRESPALVRELEERYPWLADEAGL